MQFDSTPFLIFFVIVLVTYHLLKKYFRLQNVLILAASYLFYGWWDWRFLGLIILSSSIDFFVANKLEKTSENQTRKLLLLLSITANLGILGFFKYANFFINSFVELTSKLGVALDPVTLNIILPVGISFYTFQSMSYTIDVYRKVQRAESSILSFFCYIAFFPQLVAGPIERAHHMLPQFNRAREITIEHINNGFFLLVYGLFLKVVVSNHIAQIVDSNFIVTQDSGLLTIIATFSFGIQIYCDFLAYSLIAKACASFLGIELIYNFNLPYFSQNIQEFWRRWHISLSRWLKDYLYIPLGGNRKSFNRTLINIIITMTLGGLWHGAAFNFILWGIFHGIAICIHKLYSTLNYDLLRLPFLKWIITMVTVFIGWFLFRCTSMDMFSVMVGSLGNMRWEPEYLNLILTFFALISPVILVEIIQYKKNEVYHLLKINHNLYTVIMTLFIILIISSFDKFENQFIYFQF